MQGSSVSSRAAATSLSFSACQYRRSSSTSSRSTVSGLQWLRKAILRASGFKALHDEEAIYRREAAQAAAAGDTTGARMDWYSFTVAFKGVLLEGLEVAFIVVTFGSNQGNIPLAAAGAVAAILVVTIVGLRVRAPLARVPENTLKYAVGLLLTTFGTFWAAEG